MSASMSACQRRARLTVLLLLLLFCPGSFSSALNYFNIQHNGGSLSGRIMRPSDDADYESFIGLMGKRSAGRNAAPLPKWDMDDIFVGLLGRRSSEFGTSIPKIYINRDFSNDNREKRRLNSKIRFQHTA